jgi:LuxR family maltose regulon positive regulatory protein
MNGTPEQGIPLLTTKLHVPPFRARGVRRPRLIHRLEEGLRLRHRLTLLSAPPGYGKTTLLSEWLQGGDGSRRLASPVAWVSLDEGDNDPMRFWQYVLAALQTVNPAVGQAVPPMLSQAPARPAETVAAALLNDIATASSDLILVLDDYHVIRAGAVHRSLDFLLDHLPASDPSLHVAISTRADPPLSLARRRGRAEITELRARELRFTPEEAAGFLNDAMGLGLSEDQVAALADRTEGWAVGLQLAALALQHSPTGRDDLVSTFAGDDRHVGDYLVEEVLQRQPRALRRFMLRTSILESLSGPLCDAVTGGTDGQRILTELEQANLFLVPLDNRRLWYRYHQLFADLLHRRLRREAATRELAALHQRAAAWYEQEGRIEAAVRHWLSAEEYPHAACLIEQHVADMQARGRGTTVLSWLEGLPEPLIHGHPRLCLAQAWALHGIGHVDAAEPYLQSVEQLLGAAGREPSLGDAESAEADRMLGEAAVIRGLIPLLQGAAAPAP